MNELLQTSDSEVGNIFYAGYADFRMARDAGLDLTWEVYQDNDEGRGMARDAGYTAFSVYQFSRDIDDDTELEPVVRYGSLWLDIDASDQVMEDGKIIKKPDLEKALNVARYVLTTLKEKYEVGLSELNLFASGSKGFHIEIPPYLIGSQEGDTDLHNIYLNMVRAIFILKRQDDKNMPEKTISQCIDMNMYKGGKGQLLRLPNIKRENGNYKVPVTAEEILTQEVQYFKEIVSKPRTLEEDKVHDNCATNPHLEFEYLLYKQLQHTLEVPAEKRTNLAVMENKCSFIRHCWEHPEEITEEAWFLLATLFKPFGNLGIARFITYSQRDNTRYNYEETLSKINRKLFCTTCRKIKGVFDCKRNCDVKSPIELGSRTKADQTSSKHFGIVGNKLVYYPHIDDRDEYEAISTAMEVKAKGCDNQSENWSLLVDVTDPHDKHHLRLLPFSELNTRGDDALKQLSDAGLLIEPSPKARKLVWEYITKFLPTENAIIVERNGWMETTMGKLKYCPHDLGEQADGSPYICNPCLPKEPVYEVKGTLDDWKNNIGSLIDNNPLLQIGAIMGLAGCMLTFCNEEGFGIYLHGDSSVGKSTTLHIASSVNGSTPRSWRATANGLEGIASLFNDNLLLLDEISQASPETISETIYMLANGVGKQRATRNGKARRISRWRLIYLSSGEKSTREYITEAPKTKYMAGQAVRAIDIPADAEQGYGIFTQLPSNMTSDQFTETIKEACSNYMGVPFIQFLASIKLRQEYVIKQVLFHKEYFINSRW